MKEREIQELLDTIDVLKILLKKGADERRGFGWYMVVWGFYGFINIVVAMVFGKLLWTPLIFPALWLTTIPVAGWFLSTVCWGIFAGIVFGLAFFAHVNAWVLFSLVVVGAVFNYIFLYTQAFHKGRIKHLPKPEITPKIGMFWGLVMASMVILQQLVLGKTGYYGGDLIYGMWGYALGIALFITGIIAPYFFIIGAVAAFGIPLMCMVSLEAGMSFYGFLALLMALYGLHMLKK